MTEERTKKTAEATERREAEVTEANGAAERARTEKSRMSRWIQRILIIVLIGAAFGCYYLIPSVHVGMNKVFHMFATGDFHQVEAFVQSYGRYAMAISFRLMIRQSVAAPLPAFLITFANASLFGWWQGAILSWTSAMAGAAVCFWIGRVLGRDAVIKLTSKAGLEQVDRFFDKHGAMSILIARLLPFISFDIVSYAAGHVFLEFFHRHRHRTASGNHRIFLCRRNADRREPQAGDGPDDSFCTFRPGSPHEAGLQREAG